MRTYAWKGSNNVFKLNIYYTHGYVFGKKLNFNLLALFHSLPTLTSFYSFQVTRVVEDILRIQLKGS